MWNLVLLCSRHHTVVHAQRFEFELGPDRSLRVRTATGVRVLPHPPLPWRPAQELDPQRRVHADTLPPDATQDRMDLSYAVSVLVQQAA